ncbi:MAG TPA: hypothetical protein VLD67_11525 [Vicinamibacterales bacterium]|nr:hypothetical protein [Vicinamibacterales bacterium]
MRWRRVLRSLTTTAAAAALGLVVGVPVGGAAASGGASCIGIEASSIPPPGSSEEVPGGMPALIEFVKSEIGKAGPFVSFAAKLHAGSHEACDEALEG